MKTDWKIASFKMEMNLKVTQKSTHLSLPEKTKWHPKRHTSKIKVKIQNKFYNELLKTNKPSQYVPEEGEIVEIFEIPKYAENHGLECNCSDTPATQQKLNHLWSEVVRCELHHFEKNLENLAKMSRNKVDTGETNDNKDLHSNKTYIFPHCNYCSTRVDNIRRHLRRFHKITKTAPLIANLETIVSTKTKLKPKDASAPVKTNKIKARIRIPSNRGHPSKKTSRKEEETPKNPDVNRTRIFHTKPVTKPPIWNKPKVHINTP